MALTPGTRLGTYEILGPLGAGGMGEVYRAKDLRLGREVALKILPSHFAADRGRLERFEREARIVAGLNHPNIVTLHSVEDEDGQRFLTMERLEGETLRTLIRPGGLPFAKILEIAIPLSDALAAAHERGIVHRDLKPGNVMVTSEGRVKVLDFGLARPALEKPTGGAGSDSLGSTILAEDGIEGTPPYMAPEQLRGDPADSRSDLFSFGIVLWELAAGRRLFDGTNYIEVTSSILRDAAPSLIEIRTDLPADFDRVVSRCLERNPQARAQSAVDIGNELRRLKAAADAGETSFGTASIAVLPFVNRSRDEEDEYFSDGLADELLNVLSKIDGLRVSARASSSYFKGKDVPLPEIARTLRVATVLDGTVRKSGNRLRISVQLVNASNGYHLWSETYDRTLDDVFALQDEIARSVVESLRMKLLGDKEDSRSSQRAQADVAKAAQGRGSDPEAHRLYLQARHLMDRMTPEDTARGLDLIHRAVALDPNFPLAWSQLANGYHRQAAYGWSLPLDRVWGRAREAMTKALSLQPDLAEAHVEDGWLRLMEWDWAGAEQAVSRAVQGGSGNATVLREAGTIMMHLGRFEQAIEWLQRASDLDPLSGMAYHVLGVVLHGLGRFVEAEAALQKALDLSPQRTSTRPILAFTLLELGRKDESLPVVDQEPDEALRLWGLALVHHALGNSAESEAAIVSLIEKDPDGCAYQIAIAYAVRGDSDAAFQWLERARDQRDPGLTEIQGRKQFRPLYGDPRWEPFLKSIRLR